MSGNDDAITLLSDVLEKMIDSQISNTEALTQVHNALDEINNEISDMDEKIAALKDQFSNGFRSELKERMREYAEESEKTHEEINHAIEDVKEELETFKSLGFWAKVIAAFITTLGILVAAVIKLVSILAG